MTFCNYWNSLSRGKTDAIAQHGYTVTSDEAAQVENEDDFLQLLELAIERHN